MVVTCPKCKARLKVEDEKIKVEGIKVKCPKCLTVLLVKKPPQETAPPVEKPIPPAQESAPAIEKPIPSFEEKMPVSGKAGKGTVLVAHEGEVVRSTIEGLLTEAGYQVITASDGIEAMKKIESEKPFLAILDVALSKVYGFEVCIQIKHKPDTSNTLVILVASIYDATRYKREPSSLYGADDYIEKHHIEDKLLPKINKLLEQNAPGLEEKPTPEKPTLEELIPEKPMPIEKTVIKEEFKEDYQKLEETPMHVEKVVTEGEFKEDELSQKPEPSVINSEEVEKAKRFARIIISDIALYNQNLVEKGIKNDNFYAILGAEIQEGRDLYNSRVLPELRNQGDYYKEAIDEFIGKKRKTMWSA